MKCCQILIAFGLLAVLSGCPECREIVNTARGNYTLDGAAHRFAGQVIVIECLAAKRKAETAAPESTPAPEAPLPTPRALVVPPDRENGPVALLKTADRERMQAPGRIIYTLAWQNHGEQTAEDIIICDTIVSPQEVRRVRADGEVEQTPQEGGGTLVMIKPPPLAPGASGQATIEVWVP